MAKNSNHAKSSSSNHTSTKSPFQANPAKLKTIMKLSEIPTRIEDVLVPTLYGICVSTGYRASTDSEGREQIECQLEIIDDEYEGSVMVVVFRNRTDSFITPDIGDVVKICNLKCKSGEPIYLWTRVANNGNGQIVVFNVNQNTHEIRITFSSTLGYQVTNMDADYIFKFLQFRLLNPSKLLKNRQDPWVMETNFDVVTDKPMDKIPRRYCQGHTESEVAAELDRLMDHPEKLMQMLPGTSKDDPAVWFMTSKKQTEVKVSFSRKTALKTGKPAYIEQQERESRDPEYGRQPTPEEREVLEAFVRQQEQLEDNQRNLSDLTMEPATKLEVVKAAIERIEAQSANPTSSSKRKLPNRPHKTTRAVKRSYYRSTMASPVPDSVKVVTHTNLNRAPWVELPTLDNQPPSSIGSELACGVVTTFDQVQEKKFHNHIGQVVAVFGYQGKTYLRIWDGTKLRQSNVWTVFNEKINPMYRWDSDLLNYTTGYSVDIQVYDIHEEYVKDYVKPSQIVYLHNVGFQKWSDLMLFKMPGNQGPKKNLPPESRARRIQLMHKSHPEAVKISKRLEKCLGALTCTKNNDEETSEVGVDEEEDYDSSDNYENMSIEEVTSTQPLIPSPALTNVTNMQGKPESQKNRSFQENLPSFNKALYDVVIE